MSRISRKEMKRDDLVSTLSGLTGMVEHHAQGILIVVGAIVVLIAAVGGGLWYSNSREKTAMRKLGEVYRAVSTPVRSSGEPAAAGVASFSSPQERYDQIQRLAGALMADHPSSTAARWATYWKAHVLSETGRHQEALDTMAPLLAAGEPDFLKCSAMMLQARTLEARGDIAGALDVYASLAASATAGFPVELALLNQARLLESQGRTQESLEVWRRLSQEHPESPFAREASRKLSPGSS